MKDTDLRGNFWPNLARFVVGLIGGHLEACHRLASTVGAKSSVIPRSAGAAGWSPNTTLQLAWNLLNFFKRSNILEVV